ncbi:MAG: MFS transporter, partial [Thermoproteus sp.]
SLSISLVVGPAYESAILAEYGYRYVFLFFLPLSVVLAVLSARAVVPEGRPEGGGLRATYKAALASRGLAAAVLAITAYNVPFMALVNYLPIYAGEELGLARSAAYSLFIPFFATSMATRLYMSMRPVRDVVKAFSASAVLTLAGLALIPASRGYWPLALSVALLGIPHGSVYTLSIISIARTTPLELRNPVNSLFSSYLVVLGAVAPPLLGLTAEALGYSPMWLASMAPSALAAGAFLALFAKSKELRGPI